MRIPFSWLSEFIDTTLLNPFDVVEKLSIHSVEAICEDVSFNAEGIVWGKVLKVDYVKNGYLSLGINVGNGNINIMTDYRNIKAGYIVAVAPKGARIKGKEISSKKFGEFLSEGVLVSYRDLGIDVLEDKPILGESDEHVGRDVLKDLGEGEYIIEVDILPNRGDLLSVRGLAREVAFLFKLSFNEGEEGDLSLEKDVEIEVGDEDCYRYRGVVIENVRIGESPLFIRKRLFLSGIKLINNVVDITNYVMMEEGQPLHAFDMGKLSGGIKVRSAIKGERIVTLDGSEKELSEVNLVIADAYRPVAVAGVIGSKDTGVTLHTKSILLEAAYFDPYRVRRSAKDLGISTESSYRFERNIDIENLPRAQNKAILLLEEYACGKAVALKDIYRRNFSKRVIHLFSDKYVRYSGKPIEEEDIKNLERLGFNPSAEGRYIKVEVPAYRSFDIKRDVDIIEEIMRGRGYGFYSPKPLLIISKPHLKADYIKEIKNLLVSRGFTEVINIPFEDEDMYRKVLKESPPLKLLNPLNVSEDILRSTLLISLLKVASHNFNNYNRDIAIFEISKVFEGEEEEEHLGVLAVGSKRLFPSEKWSFYDISSLLNAVSLLLGAEVEVRCERMEFLHEGVSGAIYKGEERIGVIGKINMEVAEFFDMEDTPFYMEVNIGTLIQYPREKRYYPLSKYPPVIRDLSLLMDKNISVYKLLSEIRSLLGKMIEEVKVFDIYTGSAVGEGKKSVGLRLYLRSKEGSLTNEEVNNLVNEVVETLKRKYKVKIR